MWIKPTHDGPRYRRVFYQGKMWRQWEFHGIRHVYVQHSVYPVPLWADL